MGSFPALPTEKPSIGVRIGKGVFWILVVISFAVVGHSLYVRVRGYCCGEFLRAVEDEGQVDNESFDFTNGNATEPNTETVPTERNLPERDAQPNRRTRPRQGGSRAP